jgi:hypothetical protein
VSRLRTSFWVGRLKHFFGVNVHHWFSISALVFCLSLFLFKKKVYSSLRQTT